MALVEVEENVGVEVLVEEDLVVLPLTVSVLNVVL